MNDCYRITRALAFGALLLFAGAGGLAAAPPADDHAGHDHPEGKHGQPDGKNGDHTHDHDHKHDQDCAGDHPPKSPPPKQKPPAQPGPPPGSGGCPIN